MLDQLQWIWNFAFEVQPVKSYIGLCYITSDFDARYKQSRPSSFFKDVASQIFILHRLRWGGVMTGQLCGRHYLLIFFKYIILDTD